MNKYILKNIYRPSEDTLKDYRKYDVSTVYEAQDKTGLMLPYMRPLIEGQQIVGPAVTVSVHQGIILWFMQRSRFVSQEIF